MASHASLPLSTKPDHVRGDGTRECLPADLVYCFPLIQPHFLPFPTTSPRGFVAFFTDSFFFFFDPFSLFEPLLHRRERK